MVEKIVTPIGIAKFVNLDGKGVKEGDDKYSIAVSFEANEVQELIKKLDKELANVKNANTAPYKDDEDLDEEGNKRKNGRILINFSSKYPPRIFDSALNKIDVRIGWGSKVRIAFVIKPFEYKGKRGISKYLQDIQVIELKDSSPLMFDEVEGGYVAEVGEQIPF